ncbi:MAG TPA: hypothetical protein VFA38_09115 [Nitrospirales bacterium]|nr:hypothetical protein [Nitrospirales bacterium]
MGGVCPHRRLFSDVAALGGRRDAVAGALLLVFPHRSANRRGVRQRHPRPRAVSDRTALLLEQGDAIGAHVHPYRWVERIGQWLQDFADPGWVEHCVHSSLLAMARATGRRCDIFRFGDRWHSTAAMNVLREAGVRIDLTLEPGLPPGPPLVLPGEPVAGRFDGFLTVPREPYTPSPEDFRVATNPGSLCALPLTSGPLMPNGIAGWRDWLRRMSRRPAPQATPLSMWRRWREPNTFADMITGAVAAQRRPYLAFAIRTDFGVRKDVFEAVEHCLETLLAHPLRRRFRFCSPEEALEWLAWPSGVDQAFASQCDRISRRSAFLRSRKYLDTGVAKSPVSFSA